MADAPWRSETQRSARVAGSGSLESLALALTRRDGGSSVLAFRERNVRKARRSDDLRADDVAD
jgi:hypothetical protein